VAWTLENSSLSNAVGKKKANELGIYDMSGNALELCEDVEYASARRLRGGSFFLNDYYATVARRNEFTPDRRPENFGFRLARNVSEMITVTGGTLPAESELVGQSVASFKIGKYEVTWGEWKAVRDWAVKNGYSDLVNVGQGIGDDYPVVWVNMFDALKWCNAKSELEGLKPVYKINGDIYRFGEPVYGSPVYINGVPDYLEGVNEPTLDISANGYRLPNAKEFIWAARGGVEGKNLRYPGSDQIELVAWYKDNSDGYSHKVGTKIPNELGIFDLSGNAVEWTMDRTSVIGVISKNPHVRQFGGDYSSSQNSSTVESFMFTPPIIKWGGTGFRLARNTNYDAMVSVQGGTLLSGSELAGQTVSTFEIGKYEVTWGEWKAVRDWAATNNKGYDLAGVGGTYPNGSADNFPVCYVSWYDVVKWSNAKSEMEGLTRMALT
jgi:formylglycine-generating enzyme required for sulfatase activity